MSAPQHEPSSESEVDQMLQSVVEALELTPEQRARALVEYEALHSWLSHPGTAVALQFPQVFAQGSSRLGTEIRPLSVSVGDAAQHDLDAVAEFARTQLNAMELYEAMYARLAENPRYRLHLVRKKRCVRIDFLGSFHLDVLPARPDISRPGTTSIEIPDRRLRGWLSSDPKGFASWFDRKGSEARARFQERWHSQLRKRSSVAPLPTLPTFAEKPVLNRIVQLQKRARDVVFKGAADAPRSIVLTTLAARHYDGGIELLPSFVAAVAGIAAEIRTAHPRRIEIRNPTNPDENFADAWGADDLAYQRFVGFILQLERNLVELSNARGLDEVVNLLRFLFGADPVNAAYRKLSVALRKAGDDGSLRVQRGRGLVVGASGPGIVVPASTHFGTLPELSDLRMREPSLATEK